MVRISTANVIFNVETTAIKRTIQCPKCKTFLEGVDDSVITMRCWYCEREFRIQQDPSKWVRPIESMHRRVIDRSMSNK